MINKIRKFIFSTWMCKKPYVSPHDYTPKSIRCFKDLFLDINKRENNLDLDKYDATITNVRTLDLEGMSTLWEIAINASNSIVQERAGYLLAVIWYLYMDKVKGNKWGEETNLIVERLMSLLKEK